MSEAPRAAAAVKTEARRRPSDRGARPGARVSTTPIAKSWCCAGSTWKLQAGEEIAIVGQSGVGKSTLLHVIGSLERPTAGKVLFEDRDLFAMDEQATAEFRNHKLGFVFQFHYLLADFSALENVMMPALIARLPDREARERAAEMLELVGLEGQAASAPGGIFGRRAAARRGRASGGAAAAAGAGGRTDRQPRSEDRRRSARTVSSAQPRTRFDASGRDP